jgi:hypothetical protein
MSNIFVMKPNQVRDLNDCTVFYFHGKREKQKRAIAKYVGQIPDDPNITIINTCITKPMKTSITKDLLKEWLVSFGLEKPPMITPHAYLESRLEDLPNEVLTEYKNLVKELVIIKQINFLTEDRLAGILLKGHVPFLEETKIATRNYKLMITDLKY